MAGKEDFIMDMTNAILLFTEVVEAALPFAVVLALGGRLVNLFLGMAFKGKVEI